MKRKNNILIVGAGKAGEIILREITTNARLNCHAVGLVDDDVSKVGGKILGVPVLGTCKDIQKICSELSVDEILITMPSVSPAVVQNVLLSCEGVEAKIKILPGISEIISVGPAQLNLVTDVSLEDLIGRPRVTMNSELVTEYIKGRKIIVTGAGGSIGSEICRQVLKHDPLSLTAVDISENYLFDLNRRNSCPQLTLELEDIRNRNAMETIFKNVSPDVVFHAAAYKHVPMMQPRPSSCVINNVAGSRNILELCISHNVKNAVFISTDKAVNPTSVMGASKRIMEMMVSKTARNHKKQYCSVRFGNVLGSNGSVVPIFKEQIASGGPVTITDPDMERYFMSIDEAVQLILQAGARSIGSEVFTLDMGSRIKIMELARSMIILSGHVPDQDIRITITGKRPGEKMIEELFIKTGDIVPDTDGKLMLEKPAESDGDELDELVGSLIEHAYTGDDHLCMVKLKNQFSTLEI